jgi:YggT family protein
MSALIYIIQALSHLIVFVFLLRFWLPWFRVDFRNPIAQGVLQITSPMVNPLRRIVPSLGRIDTATLLIAFAIEALTLVLIGMIGGQTPGATFLIIYSLVALVAASARIFMFAIIIRIVISWVAPHVHNPATVLLNAITEPLLRPFRRLLPPLGGFDLSPIFAIILLGAIPLLLQDIIRVLM